MATFSLTALIGPEKARQIKKFIMYTGAGVSAYTLVAWVWLAYTLVALAQGRTVFGKGGSGQFPWLFLMLTYAPVLLFILFRLWYKYAHNKDEAKEHRNLSERLYDVIVGRQNYYEDMHSRIVRDEGNYRDDASGGFTMEDLKRAAADGIELEDFEKKG